MPIEQDSDQVKRLFGIGDEVGTPEGRGTIVDIAMLVADYDGEVQLEPPSIQVELDDGRVIHTCMCELDLGDEDANEFVQHEFDRLWPPMIDGVPDDAESTIPEGEEETMQRQARRHVVREPVRFVWYTTLARRGSGGRWYDEHKVYALDPDTARAAVEDLIAAEAHRLRAWERDAFYRMRPGGAIYLEDMLQRVGEESELAGALLAGRPIVDFFMQGDYEAL